MKMRLIFFIVTCLLTVVLFGCARTPAGIPREMPADKDSAMAIGFYLDYLASGAIATLTRIHEGKMDDAIQVQEYILDEITVEVGPSLPKYTSGQRKIAVGMLESIREYHSTYPRSTSKWYQDLSPEKKQDLVKIDAMLNDVIGKAGEHVRERASAAHKNTEPILFVRNYMADIAIATLTRIRKGKTGDAIHELNDVLDRIILEYGPQIGKLSDDGRERAAGTFAKIKHYRDRYPRTGGKNEKVETMLNSITAKYKPRSIQPFFGVE